jgi:hypothetical protein
LDGNDFDQTGTIFAKIKCIKPTAKVMGLNPAGTTK